jgi:hypothetical protein
MVLGLAACGGDDISVSGDSGNGGSVIKGPNSDKIIIQKPMRPSAADDDSQKTPEKDDEPTEPTEEMVNEFDSFTLGDETLSLKDIDIKDIKNIGFEYTESWTVDTFMSASGIVYTSKDGKTLYVAVDENKNVLAVGVLADVIEVTIEPTEPAEPSESEEIETPENTEDQEEVVPETKIEVSIENASDLVLFNGLRLGMDAEEAVALFNGSKLQPLDEESEMYAAHSDEYSIIFGIDDGIISKLYLAFGKKVGLNLSAEEKLDLIKKQYDEHYKKMTRTKWPGYSDIVNYDFEINTIIINKNTYDFNTLTVKELSDAGFVPDRIILTFGDAAFTANFPVVLFVNDIGDAIEVVFDKSGNVEYLYSSSSCISLISDIRCDCQTQILKDMFEPVGVEVKDDGLTIIKSTKNTLIVEALQGNIVSVQCVNNEKAGYSTSWY